MIPGDSQGSRQMIFDIKHSSIWGNALIYAREITDVEEGGTCDVPLSPLHEYERAIE